MAAVHLTPTHPTLRPPHSMIAANNSILHKCYRRRSSSSSTSAARAAAGGRHPEQAAVADVARGAQARKAPPGTRPDVEGDAHYARVDFAAELAFDARAAFARNVARGEASVSLAEAALQIAAEDDAIASSSTVPFPVAAYAQRIQRLADEAAASAASNGAGGLGSMPADAAVAFVHDFLFGDGGGSGARLRASPAARSALPPRTRLTHPGVYESAAPAYLNEVLVRRAGHPAALAIVAHDVMQRLLLAGSLPCAALVMPPPGWDAPPRATALPNLTLAAAPAAAALNTCSSDALVELLRHLKRCYWPFAWDTTIDTAYCSHGGFQGAAKAALGSEEVTADVRAISATAQHRLQRGIFTSPGGGDLRRCVAACERLVMLISDTQPRERRDLGALYLHAGLFDEAAAELGAYLAWARGGRGGSEREDPFEVRLALALLDAAEAEVAAAAGDPDGSSGSGSGGGRETLLAPGAAGASALRGSVGAAGGSGGESKSSGSGSGSGSSAGGANPNKARLMSVAQVLEAAAGGATVGGLLGAERGKLPLTW